MIFDRPSVVVVLKILSSLLSSRPERVGPRSQLREFAFNLASIRKKLELFFYPDARVCYFNENALSVGEGLYKSYVIAFFELPTPSITLNSRVSLKIPQAFLLQS